MASFITDAPREDELTCSLPWSEAMNSYFCYLPESDDVEGIQLKAGKSFIVDQPCTMVFELRSWPGGAFTEAEHVQGLMNFSPAAPGTQRARLTKVEECGRHA
ncbi:hypothetical protein ACFPVT_00690 [Corynebacterium choanae]|uniref:hypothetical protein n=1 Tax=Corynebacterium choanae TaxID=1862358 RepID=UPI000F4F7850|nr:hypothetical protein [Corynebacterium choanae]